MLSLKKVLFIAILLLSKNIFGATYYVATTGSNINSGSSSKPFRTIAYAVNKMVAGDTTYVRGGVYKEVDGVWFKRSGTASSRIKLLNAVNEKPVIDFSLTTQTLLKRVMIQNGGGASKSIGWITIEGFEIRNGAVGIHLFNCDDCIFRRNWIHHIEHQGILGNGKNTIIDRSTINRVGVFAACAQGAAQCNLTHGIYGTGPNWKITNNLIYDNLSNGITVAGYPNCPEGYCIPGLSQAYVKNYTNDSYGGASGWIIANNTFAYNHYRSAIVLWLPLTTKSKIINNVFYENSQKFSGDANGVTFFGGAGGGHEIRNNICHATAPGSTICVASAGAGKHTSTGNITANPKFVNAPAAIPSSPNFSLTALSPAINKGLVSSVTTVDFSGRSRGSAYDIGAHEFLSGTSTFAAPQAPSGFQLREE